MFSKYCVPRPEVQCMYGFCLHLTSTNATCFQNVAWSSVKVIYFLSNYIFSENISQIHRIN